MPAPYRSGGIGNVSTLPPLRGRDGKADAADATAPLVWLLDTVDGWCGLGGYVGDELLARGQASGGLACVLLGAAEHLAATAALPGMVHCRDLGRSVSLAFDRRSERVPAQ